jgi:hypothetical protein
LRQPRIFLFGMPVPEFRDQLRHLWEGLVVLDELILGNKAFLVAVVQQQTGIDLS